ncbi:MAG TPA: hypothetical protein VJ984_16040 [Xanthomonadales bacterium]|nr:hypothetical protein [Xanthomonadales bacterium]
MKFSDLKRFALCFAVFVLGGIFSTLSAQDESSESIGADVTWQDVTAVRLDVQFPGDGYHAKWLLHRCDCGDLLIESELDIPGDLERGELLLVEQRAVLERGFRAEELQSQMSWDAPALMLQLTGYLLERSFPNGPASVTESTEIEVSENSEGIALDSGNAVGGFPAPWSVIASAKPVEGSKRNFDLEFHFAIPNSGETAKMRLKGVGDYAERDFPLSEDMPIEDWKLTWRNEDDPASSARNVRTLADLREEIAGSQLD